MNIITLDYCQIAQCCGHNQNEEVAYADLIYWLEFSQCKFIGQFKTHYANSARPSLTF